MGLPCKMMNGSKIWPTVQYGWSRWLVNMPIHTRGDAHGGTQIETTFMKWPEKSGEESILEGHFFTQDIFAQWLHLGILTEDHPYVGIDYQGDLDMSRPLV